MVAVNTPTVTTQAGNVRPTRLVPFAGTFYTHLVDNRSYAMNADIKKQPHKSFAVLFLVQGTLKCRAR